MKVLIIGLPDQVEDREISAIREIIADTLGLPIRINVLEQKDLLDFDVQKINAKRIIKESKFITAVASVLKALNNEDVEEPGIRGEFYKLVLNKVITKPVLEVIAFGPQNQQEYFFLQRNKVAKLVEYAKVALTL